MLGMPVGLLAESRQTIHDSRLTTDDQRNVEKKSKAQEVLDKVTQGLENFEDYQVLIEEKSQVYGPKGKQGVNGSSKLIVKKDKRYVEQVVSREGVQQKIVQVFDGRRSWVYDERAKLAKKIELNNISKEMRDKFKEKMTAGNMNFPDLDYKISQQTIEGKSCYVLESQKSLTRNNQVLDRIKIVIERRGVRETRDEGRGTKDEGRKTMDEGRLADKEVLLPYRQEMVSRLIVKVPAGGKDVEIKTETTQEFKDWKFNTGIKDYEFTIAMPSDVQILDGTEEAKQMMGRMMERGD